MANHSHWQTALLTLATLGLTVSVRGCGTGGEPPPSPAAVYINYEVDPAASITAKALIVPAGQRSAQTLSATIPFQHSTSIQLPAELRGDLIAGVAIFRNSCLQALSSTEALVSQRRRPPRPLIRWNKARADVALFPGCGGSSNNGQVNGLTFTVRHDLLKPDCRSQPLLVSEVTPPQSPSGSTVTLAGFNLQQGATVTVNGVAAPMVTWISPVSVQVQLPGGLSLGSASIKLTNPDGTQDTRDDLLIIAN